LTDNEAGIMSAMVMGAMKSAAKSNSLPGIISEIAGYIQATLDALRYSSPVATLGAVISPYIDSAFNCPTRDAVDARFKLKVPVWRYRFMAVFPNSQIYPDTGAYHSIDCPTVFGTTGRNVQKMPNTLEQDKFVTNVMTAWAAFAKDPENGLQALGWPKYNPESKLILPILHVDR
jgi:carboxylesterase type B